MEFLALDIWILKNLSIVLLKYKFDEIEVKFI